VDARNVLDLAWIIPLLPAVGAVVLLLFGKRIGEPISGWIATALMGLAFVGSVIAFVALLSIHPAAARSEVTQGFTWIQVGGFDVQFRFLVDPLSVTMILFVTGIGSLIHLYAIGYMHGDPRFSRFFAYMNLFAASMLVLVMGSSFLLTFLGWEGVGLCSYLLISFWFERNSAAVAGKKAFVTNRVGDFGFMLAMFLIFQHIGTLNYSALPAAHSLSHTTAAAIALLLFLGAVGKSAQLPLYFWLPDAMEGPTPVSALIHAATMVTAGVFLVIRAHAFFQGNFSGSVVAWVGGLTALFAATIAVRQNDIKRVLAYSTISQLGYMFLAAGVGAYAAALFMVIAHAFYKALLFLGAGSVIHGVHDEQDMRKMGGLKRFLPITTVTFLFGWLAIAGIFPFAGFWAKDEVLAKTFLSHNYVLWGIGIIAALLTAFYMTRQVWLVFYGNERWQTDELTPEHPPHESPALMYIPLVVLAGLSAIGGLILLPFSRLHLDLLDRWLEPVLSDTRVVGGSFVGSAALSTFALFVAFGGIILAYGLYRAGLPADGVDPLETRLGAFGRVLQNGYYIDYALSRFVSGPVTWFANFLNKDVDHTVIDGAVNGIGRGAREAGGGLRHIQTGLVRNYALAIVFGTAVLLVYLTTRVSF
jgi:NADH-quinone oxidoreductase subunit L